MIFGKQYQNNDKIKCVVLCGGKGTRLLPATISRQKSMLEVAGRPILRHVVDYWKKYTNNFIFVVHYKKEEMIEYIKALPVKSEIVEIGEPKGIAQGLRHARGFLEDNFIVALGDCLIKGDFEFPKDLNFGVGVWPTDDLGHIRSSYSVELEKNIVRKVIEKPQEIINNLCGMGSYFFNKKIFDYIDKTEPSAVRDQIELTDSIQKAIDEGEIVKGVKFNGIYININNKEDLEKAEKLFDCSL